MNGNIIIAAPLPASWLPVPDTSWQQHVPAVSEQVSELMSAVVKPKYNVRWAKCKLIVNSIVFLFC